MPPPRRPEVGRNLVNQRGASTGANSDKYIPQMIQCYVCKRHKPKEQYANRQLQRLRDSVHNPYAPGGRTSGDPKTTCRACTPAQTTELQCIICERVKGLDLFAKNQRKNPDRARCIKCVQMHLDTEPDIEPPSSDEYTDSPDSSDDEDFDEGKLEKATTASMTSRNQLVKTHDSKPVVHRGFISANYQENSTIGGYKDFMNASRSSPSVSSDEADQWEPVKTAGTKASKVIQKPPTAGSVVSATGKFQGVYKYGTPRTMPTKKNGWAVIDKVHKGKEKRWGEEAEEEEPIEDEWTAYSRQIREKREGKKPTKKKAVLSKDEEDDDW